MHDDTPYDEPAFPRDWRHPGHNGMTLRDWFAGQALAGYFAYNHVGHQNAADQQTAEYCYEMADAMLLARQGGAS